MKRATAFVLIGLIARRARARDERVHRRPAQGRHQVPAGRGGRGADRAGPVFPGPGAAERAPLRHAHPDAGFARCRALPHQREQERARGLLREVARDRRAPVLRLGARRSRRRRGAHLADGQRRAARGIRQAHRARRGLGRAREDHATVAEQGRQGRARHRRGSRRRAPEARRPRAGDLLGRLSPHGVGAQARGQRAARHRPGRGREDQGRGRPRSAR